MNITVITLFPEMFSGVFGQSIISRAIQKQQVRLSYVQLRDFASDAYKTVDDHPYGGGHGMILRVDVMDRALAHAKTLHPEAPYTVLLDAQGTPYRQKTAARLSGERHLILVCGHYEGFDERIRTLVDEEISIGDYVLTGGELPAMVLVDSIVRLLPGVLSKKEATREESFTQQEELLEYPQYTRPEEYKDMRVPDVLVSGNHARIRDWRQSQVIENTRKKRPDLVRNKTKG